MRAPFFFGLSMGTASFPDQGTTFDALVRMAEEGRLEDKRRQVSRPRSVEAAGAADPPAAPVPAPRRPGDT
jgi:hypothetical protein